MTSSEGWDELRAPRSGDSVAPRAERPVSGLGNGLRLTPFTRLARVHALSAMGDGLIAVALAGSIFFSIDPSDARWRVALYLVLTIAPFAVVTPLLGPVIDRAKGGRRGMIIGSAAARAVVAFFMVRHIDSLLLFPEAFAMLVLQKAYVVSKTALVPAVCPREEELIEANSKLSLLSAFAGVFGGGIGAALVWAIGGGAATGFAVVVFLGAAVMATQLPQVQVAAEPADATEKLEVRGANIVLAATAVGVLKSIVGFTTFLLAFHLRAGEDGIDMSGTGAGVGAVFAERNGGIDALGTPGPPSWHFGAAGLAAGVGAFLGAKYAPRIRQAVPEERIVLGALVAVSAMAFLGAWGGGISGTALLAFGVGITGGLGKLGFDALVQRDAPRANHGRVFAKFEGRFQMMWALGAFIPVIIPLGIRPGALLVGLAAAFAAASYDLGRRTDRVQKSSRVREALRERVPGGVPSGRAALGSIGERIQPLRNRVRGGADAPAVPVAPAGAVDPTVVAQRPEAPKEPTVRPDLIDWGVPAEPQVSSGDGVWVAPPEPDLDSTTEFPTDPTEEGQFRLWD
jgi:hypothetical protein